MQRATKYGFLVVSILLALLAVLSVHELEQANISGAVVEQPRTHHTPGIELQTNMMLRNSHVPPINRLAEYRKQQMLRFAENDPEMFLDNIISESRRSQLPTRIRQHVEEEQTVTGTIHVEYAENFQHPEQTKKKYVLETQDAEYRIHNTEPLLDVETGSRARLNGYVLEDQMVLNTQPLFVQATSNEPKATGTKRVLLVPLTFEDTSVARMSELDIKEKFTEEGGIMDWFNEVSYGQLQLQLTTVEWQVAPRSEKSWYGNCFTAIPSAVVDFLSARGFSLSRYDIIHVAYHTSCDPGWAGYASLGSRNYRLADGSQTELSVSMTRTTFLDEYYSKDDYDEEILDYFQTTAIHEIGHNLGGGHAKSRECTPGEHPLHSHTCRLDEYGNDFDALGNAYGGHATHFNAYMKDFLGWLQPISITQSGVYVINPYQQRNGVRSAKIQTEQMQEGQAVYLEYRHPAGMDGGLLGPQVRANTRGLLATYKQADQTTTSQLLDLHHNTQSTPQEQEFVVALTKPSETDTEIFISDEYEFTIGPVLRTTPRGITFEVNFPITLSFDSTTSGSTAQLRWSANNAQSCKASGSWSGELPTQGTQIVSAQGTQRYTIICNAGPYQAQRSVFFNDPRQQS